MTTPPRQRLRAGLTMSGRGIDRCEIACVVDDTDTIVARLGRVWTGDSDAHDFIAGREAGYNGVPVHPDDLTIIAVRGGEGVFQSTSHVVMHGDVELHSTKWADNAKAFVTGWRHSLKERGLLSRSGKLKQS